jgi:hypothetical protein
MNRSERPAPVSSTVRDSIEALMRDVPAASDLRWKIRRLGEQIYREGYEDGYLNGWRVARDDAYAAAEEKREAARAGRAEGPWPEAEARWQADLRDAWTQDHQAGHPQGRGSCPFCRSTEFTHDAGRQS